MYHICKKTCNKCGLIYICKTEQDPYRYEGSGTKWREHNKLDNCGIDHHTEVLFSSDSKEKSMEFCTKYGKETNPYYWKKPEYANLIMEGGGYNMLGDANPNLKHGRAVGWKSDKSIQKENDRIRNADYHANNREVERARMRCRHHIKKGNYEKALENFNKWNPKSTTFQEYWNKYAPAEELE